jgi:RNA polymerase sigma-54 factor
MEASLRRIAAGGRMKTRSRISVQQTQRLTLTATLAASIHVLRADAVGLSRYLEEQAAENPQLILTRPTATDWTPRWKSALHAEGGTPDVAAAGPSLVAYALDVLDRLRLTPRDGQIGLALVEALEPSGWLGRDPYVIAREVGATVTEVEAILRKLQARAEPIGLFARTLADCLRLQAEDAGEADAAMLAVLDRLPLIARGELDRLARETGLSVADIRARIDMLRRYDPKPGTSFAPHAAPVREPDLIAEKGEAGWIVSLNRSTLPAVSVAEGRGKGRAEARAILRMVEGRNTTLLAVGQEILMRQAAVLDEGLGALVPMTMADVASALLLHESTVSRVVAGTSVDTPRGTWWLRAFFTTAAREGGPAAGALRDRLARLVAAEDAARPLSDEALALALADGGAAPIARRTVAKYRAMLNLPPAHRRRQRP